MQHTTLYDHLETTLCNTFLFKKNSPTNLRGDGYIIRVLNRSHYSHDIILAGVGYEMKMQKAWTWNESNRREIHVFDMAMHI